MERHTWQILWKIFKRWALTLLYPGYCRTPQGGLGNQYNPGQISTLGFTPFKPWIMGAG
jgi:hypothetical protein